MYTSMLFYSLLPDSALERGKYGQYICTYKSVKLAIMLTRASILGAAEHVLKATGATQTCETITSKIRPKLLSHRTAGYTSASSANWSHLWAILMYSALLVSSKFLFFWFVPLYYFYIWIFITFFLWIHSIFQNICQILEIATTLYNLIFWALLYTSKF